MNPINTLTKAASLALLTPALLSCESRAPKTLPPPNIVIIFLDDAGWADFEPFTENTYPTPNVRQLAKEGCVYHQFYVPQAVCSASRAALLTGCYPERTKMFGAHAPRHRGLNPEFTTLASLLQYRGYATGFFGKWHIGDQEETRPHNRGFDESAGIMYSNDMWAGHPVRPDFFGQWPLQYWENGQITIDSVTAADQTYFTTWFTEKSVDFINRNKDNPFFLYLAHPQPHVPLFVSEKFEGASGSGLYGDVIMEIDWSVGEVMKALKDNHIDHNTLFIFTSDNGPWLPYGNHSGKTPFRGEKTTSFDGGVRSPLIIKFPPGIEAGTVSHKAFCSIDLLPTLCNLAGASLPDYEIDGKDVWPLIAGKDGATNPHSYYAFTTNFDFEALLSGCGRWKLHLPHSYRFTEKGGRDGYPGHFITKELEASLFDMWHDPYEKVNVIDQYPEIAGHLLDLAQQHKERFFY